MMVLSQGQLRAVDLKNIPRIFIKDAIQKMPFIKMPFKRCHSNDV
jgi:hypothetical protein